MHLDSRVLLAAVAAPHGDVDEPGGALAHPERVAGTRVAEEGVVADREDCRPPAAVGAEHVVTDHVDAPMARVQAAGAYTALDRRGREAEVAELVVGDVAVLAARDSG